MKFYCNFVLILVTESRAYCKKVLGMSFSYVLKKRLDFRKEIFMKKEFGEFQVTEDFYFLANEITVPTHNKRIFVRPKKCAYFVKCAYFGRTQC